MYVNIIIICIFCLKCSKVQQYNPLIFEIEIMIAKSVDKWRAPIYIMCIMS